MSVENLILEQISIEHTDVHERLYLNRLSINVVISEDFSLQKEAETALNEERWHQGHGVVGENELVTEVNVSLVQKDFAVILGVLGHLIAETSDVHLGELLHWLDCHEGLETSFLHLHVLVDHCRLPEEF